MKGIRPYQTSDKKAVLRLVELNTPEYFHPSEEKDLSDYLEDEREEYFVVEENSEIIGAGGINYFPDEAKARISWDIISPLAQGKGVGSKLVQFRISHIRKHKDIKLIEVRTSQLVYEFYEKLGFTLQEVRKDFWGDGYDLYVMEVVN